jgi:hypothetical protein
MSEAVHPQPPADDPPLDPLDEELVAYLDGELAEEQARQLEQRLASDPQLRHRAMLLKKTYDLLDYLPCPEAPADFATRTLEKIPALKSSPAVLAVSSQPPVFTAPAASASSSVPLVVPATSHPDIVPTRWVAILQRPWLWLLFTLMAASAGGYALLMSLLPSSRATLVPPSSSEPSLADHRLIQMLPLYIGVDDLAFLLRLAEPEYFGDDPLVDNNSGRRTSPTTWETPSTLWPQLLEEYKRLPPQRQAALQELDRELFALDATERDYLLQILEAYAFWLSRLPEPARQSVLCAPTSAERLQQIRELREQQWLETLPSTQQEHLRTLPTHERIEAVRRLKRLEADRRETWSLVRRHAQAIVTNSVPWPFHHPTLRQQVIDFANRTFRLTPTDKPRLSANEHNRYLALLHQAEQHGGWSWFYYGQELYTLTRKYERFILPLPLGKPIQDLEDLPGVARFFDKGRAGAFIQPHRGKWPDFALAVHDYYHSLPLPDRPRLPPLGPARPEEFQEPLRQAIEQQLWPKLRPQDRKALQSYEGKWPDYCRELRKWAWFYDVALPELMLPGSPRQWEIWYGPKPPPGLHRFPPFPPITPPTPTSG